MTLPVPYPADTKAKGWRFEIDYEKVEQSDTWTLASFEVRPWLLMLWMTAWKQVPCGSLVNDDALIAARIGMSTKIFSKHRDILLRGWWLAEDGRLYHDTIALRVHEMLEYRRKEAERRARNRVKPPAVPELSRGTNTGQQQDSTRAPDTGTSTGTGTSNTSSLRSDVPRPTSGEVCKAMKSAGLQSVNPSHPKLQALIDAGITLPEFIDAAQHAFKNQKPFAYALATAEGRRRDAATPALPTAGPNKQEALEASNAAVVARMLEGENHVAH